MMNRLRFPWFRSATKSIRAHRQIARDANSAKKTALHPSDGPSASHIALECALRPSDRLLDFEEVERNQTTLKELSRYG